MAETSYLDALVRMELPCGGGNISPAWWCRDGVAGCWRDSLAELMLVEKLQPCGGGNLSPSCLNERYPPYGGDCLSLGAV